MRPSTATLRPALLGASLVLLVAQHAAAGAGPGPGAASHWRFDETKGTVAHDSAGPFNGTILGAPSFVRGVAGNAIKMSRASNDRITVGTVYSGSTAFSVSLWVKIAPGAPGDNYPVSNHYAGIVNGWIFFTGTSGGCYGDPNSPSLYTADNCGGEVTAPVNVNDGGWHHLVATYTPGGTKSIYVDGGVADATAFANPINVNGGAQFLIGGVVVSGSPTAAFDGWIDDLQVYTRPLGCAEVQYLYAHPGEEVPVLSDLNGDGAVDAMDLAILLGAWGPCGAGPCSTDLDCSGSVDAADLAILLGAWTG